jgi:hypothetical protein
VETSPCWSPDGREIRRFGEKGTGPSQFDLPTDVAFDDAGNIYVSEYGDNNRIQIFDKDLNYLRGWGTIGSADGQMARPQSLVIVGDAAQFIDALRVKYPDVEIIPISALNLDAAALQLAFNALDADKDGFLIRPDLEVSSDGRDGKEWH